MCEGKGNIGNLCTLPSIVINLNNTYTYGEATDNDKESLLGYFFLYYSYSNFNFRKMNDIIQQYCVLILVLNIGQSLENI